MGFWGTFLVARSDKPLTELDDVRELAGNVLWHGEGDDGWQVLQLHRAPEGWGPPMTGGDDREDLLTSVMAQTASPVLAAIVLDSDGAQLIGYSPRAGRWSGWLKLEVLIDYLEWQYREHLEVDDDEELPDDLDTFWEERYREACRPLYELVPPADVAAPHAVAWAVEAGYAPAVDEVEAVLAGGEAFAEDQFLKLLLALGLPTPAPTGDLLADSGEGG
ncbi:hypothetical protein ACQHIV_36910 [Kribbella sp. GL6]|uniref:hypothetical protein n=1 Tax=Kribbella sp. GL6 TaxID=3419765 RepID=UPI003CFC4E29